MALFRTDYSGRGELSERQQKVGCGLAKVVDVGADWILARSNAGEIV